MCTVSVGEFTADSIRPSYGPLTGGTRVTISGQFLSVFSVDAVYIGADIRAVEPDRLYSRPTQLLLF